MPSSRGWLLAVVLFMQASCTFVEHARLLHGEPNFERLSELLAEAEGMRAAGEPIDTWYQGRRWYFPRCEDWNELLGDLYAQRSGSVVREVPYCSLTGTFVWFWGSAITGIDETVIVPSLMIGASVPVVLPFEVIYTPLWFVSGAVREASVTDEELRQAVADIQRARQLGYTDERVFASGSMGWPRPFSRHLDVIGYDEEWLRAHGGEQ